MKEYTYINKAYLGIKEGVVPPTPQYLWLNSKDDRLYKFGDNGWEVINNAPYIVDEFVVRDIISLTNHSTQQLIISRVFLDAMYKGVPIMVKMYRNQGEIVPINVITIGNPSESTQFCFRVEALNKVLEVNCVNETVITGNELLNVTVTHSNLIDWNENDASTPGYIANRTHHLGNKQGPYYMGQRVSLVGTKGTHYFTNYKVLYDGKFYDLPPMKKSGAFTIDNYFRLEFMGYSESGNTSTYTYMSEQLSQSLPSQTFVIYRDVEERNEHKTLDDFFLPEEAKPWKYINATRSSPGFVFCDISDANIGDGDNAIRNKTLYYTSGGTIHINPPTSFNIIEFKIYVGTAHNLIINSKCVWENGTKPQVSPGEEVIYSFLILRGYVYASAKVYRSA
jgi:hypothetical protein